MVFSGDNDYNPAPMASCKLKIIKKTTKIGAKDISFKSTKKSKIISVKLKTDKNPYNHKMYLSKGKIITLKVNGKKYVGKTNSKNIVKFKVKLTKKGKYVAKIKFNGDSTYLKSNKSIKIKIR